jgi:integrase
MVIKRNFTDRLLRAIKPTPRGRRTIIWDAQIPGFGIRVTERSGAANIGAFVLVTRFPGKKDPAPRRIGAYPDMPLAKAREIARQWRELIGQGVDPAAKEANLREQAPPRPRAVTFLVAFNAFADDHLSTLRTGQSVKRIIEKHVFPSWAERPIAEIARADVRALIASLRKQMRVGANRVLANLKTFFRWAVDQELIEASPASAVKRPAKEVKRDRVLSDWEIQAIWRACGEFGVFGRAFKTMLATGQRRSEVGAMTWAEIDRGESRWALPRERTKSDRAHEVPLSALTLSILEECPRLGDHVFATPRRSGEGESRRGGARAISGWSKAKSALDKLAFEKAVALAVARGDRPPEKFAEWRLHDLRRTAATYMAKLGVERVVIGKVLNHAEREVTAIYDRHRYDREKRRALDLWGETLAALVGADCGGAVRDSAPTQGRSSPAQGALTE